MQIIPMLRPTPVIRFGANEVQREKTSLKSSAYNGKYPYLVEDLRYAEGPLNTLLDQVKHGSVEFISGHELFEDHAKQLDHAVCPSIALTINGKPYTFTPQFYYDTPGNICFSLRRKDPASQEQPWLFFANTPNPKTGEAKSVSLQTPQNPNTEWHRMHDTEDFPRPDLIAKATELGNLLLLKLGESRKAQGQTTSLLPEPQKQLDHQA